tara:strand:- start:47 stop:898 length:852 start_codon:yes stop_codon:yes gene_type:complete
MTIKKGTFKYFIDKDEVIRSYEGVINEDSEKAIEILSDENLLDGNSQNKKGFTVHPFLNQNDFKKLVSSVYKFLSNAFEIDLDKKNITSELNNIPDEEFKEKMKGLYYGIPFEELIFSKGELEEWASKMINKKLTCDDLPAKGDGIYVGPAGPQSIQIRIVRPNKADFNPPHRDIYFDTLRDGINCFMPIHGVNNKSSLPLTEGSHMWEENKTIRTEKFPLIDGRKFSVPAILSHSDGSILKLTRPKVKDGEVMFFSPYLIHGGGINLGKEVRISFEFRFWRK